MSYLCHECLGGFDLESEELICPNCESGFIELVNNNNRIYPNDSGSSNLYLSEEDESEESIVEESGLTNITLDTPVDFDAPLFNPRRPYNFTAPPPIMDYPDFARLFFNLGFGPRGMNNNRRVNLEDYGIGHSFDDILNRSFLEHQGNGPPPASKKEVERLKKVHINNEHVESSVECSVCKDKYLLNEECDLLPCDHFFHKDCIRPWLELHNTCPICRYELKTDTCEDDDTKSQNVNNNEITNNDVDVVENHIVIETPSSPKTKPKPSSPRPPYIRKPVSPRNITNASNPSTKGPRSLNSSPMSKTNNNSRQRYPNNKKPPVKKSEPVSPGSNYNDNNTNTVSPRTTNNTSNNNNTKRTPKANNNPNPIQRPPQNRRKPLPKKQ